MPDNSAGNFLDDLSNGDKAILGGSLVFLIAMFLPWYGADYHFGGFNESASANGFVSWGWLAFIAFLAVIALWLVRGPMSDSVKLPDMPTSDAMLYMILGGVEVAGVLLYWLAGHNDLGGFSGPGLSIGVRFGLFIALVGGALTIFGGYLKQTEPQAVGRVSSPGGYGAAPPPPPQSYGAPPPAAPPSTPPAAPPPPPQSYGAPPPPPAGNPGAPEGGSTPPPSTPPAG